jgi:hypothetical protein
VGSWSRETIRSTFSVESWEWGEYMFNVLFGDWGVGRIYVQCFLWGVGSSENILLMFSGENGEWGEYMFIVFCGEWGVRRIYLQCFLW